MKEVFRKYGDGGARIPHEMAQLVRDMRRQGAMGKDIAVALGIPPSTVRGVLYAGTWR